MATDYMTASQFRAANLLIQRCDVMILKGIVDL
jgi:hypothetical protein